MEVYWVEQSEAHVPQTNEWLGSGELRHFDTLRFPKRRMEWLLGRWTAKCALAVFRRLPLHTDTLADIEIHPAPSGAPAVFISNKPADITISISHRSGRAICALARGGVELGCDLELIEAHSQAFMEDYLTHEEQLLVAQASAEDRDRMVALLWSAKESALKAMQVGLRVDTRCVTIHPEQGRLLGQWAPLTAHSTAANRFHGWWRQEDAWLQTLVAEPSPDRPIQLQLPPDQRFIGGPESRTQRASRI